MNSYYHDSVPYQKESDFYRILRSRKQVPVNTILILLNVLVFIGVELTGSSENTIHMYRWGAAYAPAILQGEEYFRLLTSMFLHFGIQHLGNNMLVLLFLGDCLERNIGKWRYAAIYFIGGIGANIFSIYWEIRQMNLAVSAGASGAVFAVIGALIYVVIANKGSLENFTAKRLIFMAALSIYLGMTGSNVGNAAHIGGLFLGLILGVILYHKTKKANKRENIW